MKQWQVVCTVFLSSLLVFFPASMYSICEFEKNTYAINDCLKQAMQKADITLKRESGLPKKQVEKFIQWRHAICELSSDRYKGGTYEGVRYGHCVLSLTSWFVKELRP